MRIIQKFNWDLNDITRDVINDKTQGFDAILIAPFQKLKQPSTLENLIGNDWWLAYQPCDFNPRNVFEFERLCEEAHRHGMKIIVDIVCNHVAGDNNGGLNLNNNVDEYIKRNQNYFIKKRKFYDGKYHVLQKGWNSDGFNAEVIKDWNNRNDVITGCMKGLPSLNTFDHEVQDMIFGYMNKLIELGADGFRIDAAKSIALPEEGCDFFTRMKEQVKDTKLGNKPYFFSEVLYSNNKDIVMKYLNYTDVYTDNWDVRDNDDRAIGCFESHDQFLQPQEFNHRILYGNEYGHAYCNLTSRKSKTILYVRNDDYRKIREIHRLEDNLLRESNPRRRIDLQNQINNSKNNIAYYNEYVRNANILNSYDNIDKKSELDFYEFIKSINFINLNTVLYEYENDNKNELDRITSSMMNQICKWISENYNKTINNDLDYSPIKINKYETDTLVTQFFNTLSPEFGKLYNEWKDDYKEITFYNKPINENRKSYILDEGNAVIDLKGNVNDVSEIVYQVVQKMMIKNTNGNQNKDYLNKVVAMTCELLVKDFLSSKGYNINHKIKTRYNRVNNYASVMSFENNLINAYMKHEDLTPHYMYEYCKDNNLDLSKTFFNKETIVKINKINMEGKLSSSKAMKYVVGGVVAPKVHEDIVLGKLDKNVLVDIINNINNYTYHDMLMKLGINLKELNDPKKIEEFINPFINLSYEIKNYGLYDKKIELKR